MANFFGEWAHRGFVLVLVVGGSTPGAKIANMKHITVREKSRSQVIDKRQQLRSAHKLLDKDALTLDARNNILADCAKLGKAIKRAETQSVNAVPRNYASLLSDALLHILAHKMNTSRGTVCKVKLAHFQADSLLNQLYVDGDCKFIMSTDVDYPIQNGDGCMAKNKPQ